MPMQHISKLRQKVQEAIDYFSVTEDNLKTDQVYYIKALINYILQLENAILEQTIEELEKYNERER